MEFLKKYLGAGYKKNNKTGMVTLTITKISYLSKIKIPLFEKYPLIGVKQWDFQDWSEVAKLMNAGGRSLLTNEVLDLIKKLKLEWTKVESLSKNLIGALSRPLFYVWFLW